MQVTAGLMIRDASGDFGCPNCWSTHMTRANPEHATCPQCGVALEWNDETRENSAIWKAYQFKRQHSRG